MVKETINSYSLLFFIWLTDVYKTKLPNTRIL